MSTTPKRPRRSGSSRLSFDDLDHAGDLATFRRSSGVATHHDDAGVGVFLGQLDGLAALGVPLRRDGAGG